MNEKAPKRKFALINMVSIEAIKSAIARDVNQQKIIVDKFFNQGSQFLIVSIL